MKNQFIEFLTLIQVVFDSRTIAGYFCSDSCVSHWNYFR